MNTIKTLNKYPQISISVTLLIFVTLLFIFNKISEGIFTTLFAISILSGFIIHFGNRLKSVEILQMKLLLYEAKEVENSVKDIATSIVEIIAALSAQASGTGKQRKKLNEKLLGLLKLIKTDEKKIDAIMHNPKLVEKLMSSKDGSKELEEARKQLDDEKYFES